MSLQLQRHGTLSNRICHSQSRSILPIFFICNVITRTGRRGRPDPDLIVLLPSIISRGVSDS